MTLIFDFKPCSINYDITTQQENAQLETTWILRSLHLEGITHFGKSYSTHKSSLDGWRELDQETVVKLYRQVHMKVTWGHSRLGFKMFYRRYHIRVYYLVIDWHTLECNIWIWVRSCWSGTFDLGLNHIRLQHFYMIKHAKCCSLIWFNPRPNVTL